MKYIYIKENVHLLAYIKHTRNHSLFALLKTRNSKSPKMFYVISIAIWAIVQISAAPNYGPIVETELMKIRGRWNVTYAGRPYKIFEGVPYGEPPEGERRFQVLDCNII